MPTQKPSLLQTILAIFVVANLLIIDGFVLLFFINPDALSLRQTVVQYITTPAQETAKSSTNAPTNPNSCAPACVALIENATAAASLTGKTAATPTPVASTTTARTTTKSLVLYIPIGTGYTTNNEWTDIAGSESYINTADYGTISDVRFEASLHMNPANGNVYARLYNVTDSHPVWSSEITGITDVSTQYSSGKITLDSGNKLYRLQLKSSIQQPAYANGARVKITAQQ